MKLEDRFLTMCWFDTVNENLGIDYEFRLLLPNLIYFVKHISFYLTIIYHGITTFF